jgi:DnaK suppressor protein
VEHFTKRKMHILTELLQQREANARAEIRELAGHRADEPYRDLAGSVSDTGDEAVADVIVDVDNALIGQQLEQLREIYAARDEMQKGIYGLCLDCGGEIDFERLSACPTAKRCVTCQGMHERTYAEVRHTTL